MSENNLELVQIVLMPFPEVNLACVFREGTTAGYSWKVKGNSIIASKNAGFSLNFKLHSHDRIKSAIQNKSQITLNSGVKYFH